MQGWLSCRASQLTPAFSRKCAVARLRFEGLLLLPEVGFGLSTEFAELPPKAQALPREQSLHPRKEAVAGLPPSDGPKSGKLRW